MRTRPWLRAFVLCAAPCFCAGTFSPVTARAQSGAATPSPEAVDKAQNLFKKGAALFEKKKIALALEQFRASYAAVPSPNSRLYIARCLAELGSTSEAYLEFDATAEEAAARAPSEERYAKTQQTALLERDELARKLALVTVTVAHPEAARSLAIAGVDVPRDRWGKPYPLKPGSVELVVRSTAGSPVTQTITVAAGDTKTVALDATPSVAAAPPPEQAPVEAETPETPAAGDTGPSRRWLRPYAYVSAGVGVAGFALFTVAGLMANSTYSDLSKRCGDGPCPPDQQDDVDSGRTQKTVANVGLVVGALGLVGGTTLFILSLSGGSKDTPTAAARQLVVGPSFAGVRGTF